MNETSGPAPAALDEAETPVERALRRFITKSARPDLSAVEGADVRYTVEELSIGRMLIATRPGGTVITSAFAPDADREEALLDQVARAVSPRVLRGGNEPGQVVRQLEEYLNGDRTRFDLQLDLELTTPFQRIVLTALPEVAGYGHTASYRDLAVAVDRPKAMRAVGVSLSANPLCVLLPCHRIISSSGALNGYAGGVETKSALLTLEREASG
jgi:methylated-DNA-[protein]-cysteine S-methyltransferase